MHRSQDDVAGRARVGRAHPSVAGSQNRDSNRLGDRPPLSSQDKHRSTHIAQADFHCSGGFRDLLAGEETRWQ
jgi:hypothetical protein